MTDDVSGLRPRPVSVAYRMLGSVADAEDAVQDAFLRYQTASGVSSPEGFLVRTTTRLCIDRLRERRRREYVGPWVPEPVATRTEKRDAALGECQRVANRILQVLVTFPGGEALSDNRNNRLTHDFDAVTGRPATSIREYVAKHPEMFGSSEPARVFP